MIPIKYIGAFQDSSGYAQAARAHAGALLSTGQVDMQTHFVSFEEKKTTHGSAAAILTKLLDNQVIPSIQIVHLTPDNFLQHHNSSLYNIGYSAWETDRLPAEWIRYLNKMQEIWVPSEWNVGVFKNSGVTVPVFCMPHPVKPLDLSEALPVEVGSPDTFVFYSIFQWIVRKNPISLLTAYLTEFTPADNVVLLLKSYRLNTSPQEKEIIKNDVRLLKRGLRLPGEIYPPVVLFGDLEPQERMLGIHKRGDCFILVQKGEGFGLCQSQAMSIGKPCISTNYGGNLQFMNHENSLLVDGFVTPCAGMLFPNYHAHMNWFEPSISDIKRKMRWVFEHRGEAAAMGEKGRETILSTLSEEKIGQQMLTRLQTIQRTLVK